MALEYIGLKDISGPLVAIEGVNGVSNEEIVDIYMDNGEKRTGQVITLEGDVAIVQVFEGSTGMSLVNTTSKFSGHTLHIPVSKEMLGRVFDGVGRPVDGLGEIYPEKRLDINGNPINPISREYPRNFIQTGISSIDALMTLIRGQKLPIFSGSGMPHDQLAVQIVRNAKIEGDQEFAIVFAAMGVKHDVANYFKRSFEESGALERVVMFLNLSNDPVVERIVTPRCAPVSYTHLDV